MTWNQRYRLRRFARDSLWLLPLLGALCGLALSLLVAGPGERISYSLLRRLDDTTVPDLGVVLAGVLMGVGLLLFLLFLNRFVHGRTPNLGQWAFRDGGDRLRLLVPAPRWEDYVALTVTEIRLFGAGSMQVVRGDADVALTFRESPDLDRARTADRQGIGGRLRLGAVAMDNGPMLGGGR